MTLEQKAHDIGIAFATVKFQARIASNNSDESDIIRQTQYLNFVSDYSFASSEVILGNDDFEKA